MTRVKPAAAAATTFSLMPPTVSTRPLNEISPVMAVSLRTVRSVNREVSALSANGRHPQPFDSPTSDPAEEFLRRESFFADNILLGGRSDLDRRFDL